MIKLSNGKLVPQSSVMIGNTGEKLPNAREILK